MKNLNYLNSKRVDVFRDGRLGDEKNGAFAFEFNGSRYFVIASNGEGWEHVSVSNNQRIPSWEIMCKVKDMFFENDEVVIQCHPKKADYVNIHDNCLHLWRPIGVEIPTPPRKLV